MLASFFVVNGAKSALKPDDFVADAEPVAKRLVPLAQRVAPPSVAAYVPEDTRALVRYSGIAQVLGGLGLATGIGRRGSSALLTASMIPHVLASTPKKGATSEERTAARSLLLRNVALLGATLIAANDTQGKPSLAYLAARQQRKIAKATQRQQSSLSKAAHEQQAALVSFASEKQQDLAKVTRKQRKQLAKKQHHLSKVAAKRQKEFAKVANKKQQELTKTASKKQREWSKQAGKLSEQAREQVQQFADQVQSAL